MIPALSIAPLPSPQKNVLLWHWGQAGAGAKFTHELARELRKVGGVNPIVSAAEGSELATFAAPDMPTHLVRTFRGDKSSIAGKFAAAHGVLGLPRLADSFRAAMDTLPAHVALCTMQSIWDVAALPALKGERNRFIFVLHDASFHPGDSYPFRQTVVRWQVEAADALIVLSDHVHQAAQARYGFPAERIWTIPHGSFTFGSTPPTGRRYPHGQPLRLLFFGRILAYKGLGHLLDAYRILRERNVPVELDIVGSGDLSPYRTRLKNLSGISVSNKWVNDNEIADTLARADIVVLPYIEASQSGVAASALTAGLPIVATPVGGLVEQVQDGRSGRIARGMTAEDLAEAIRSLVERPSFYESCSAGALDVAQEDLGWGRIADSVAGIIDRVVALPRRNARR